MPTEPNNKSQSTDKNEQILDTLQDLFILQALQAGMSVDSVRKLLHVGKWRVTNISKALGRETKKPK